MKTATTFQSTELQSLIVQLVQHLPENITVNFYIGHITHGDNSPIKGTLSVNRINGDNNQITEDINDIDVNNENNPNAILMGGIVGNGQNQQSKII